MEASARWNAGQGPLLDTQEDTEPSPAPADKEPGVTSNENAYAHNREMQQQEAAHIQGNSDREEVNARWTILEGLTLLLIALAQVMYLRKFFEKRRYL